MENKYSRIAKPSQKPTGVGLHRNIEPHAAKAYENQQNPERFPVNTFSTYVSKLPQDRITEAFYFKPLSVFANKSVWYSKQPVGKNKLDVTVKSVMEKANVSGFFTNQSLRATTATRLFNADIPEQLIREQTGHRNNALWSYNRPSEAQKRKVSEVLQLQEDNAPSAAKQPTTLTGIGASLPSLVFNNSTINIYFSK